MADTGLEIQPDRVEKLGPFIGVFTPSVLTILGVILYLRTGWVVGNVGLPRALLIVTIANAITLLTSLSVSAVSTNMRVRAGGAYYIISRSLGLEIGAAIGIPLFLAQALSVFSETSTHNCPIGTNCYSYLAESNKTLMEPPI